MKVAYKKQIKVAHNKTNKIGNFCLSTCKQLLKGTYTEANKIAFLKTNKSCLQEDK